MEVLTCKATNAYKAFLRKLRISYIIAGQDALDYALVMRKMSDLFHMQTLMLSGGGILNWSFIPAGLYDEISTVIAPAADGSSITLSLFETQRGLADDNLVGFIFENAKLMDSSSV